MVPPQKRSGKGEAGKGQWLQGLRRERSMSWWSAEDV